VKITAMQTTGDGSYVEIELNDGDASLTVTLVEAREFRIGDKVKLALLKPEPARKKPATLAEKIVAAKKGGRS
jgi:hypothetical protein